LFSCQATPANIGLNIGKRQGSYAGMPKNRGYLLSVHCPKEPARVLLGTFPLNRVDSQPALVAKGADPGWSYDPQKRIIWIKTAAGWYYGPDARGDKDPEKDTVYWLASANPQERAFSVSIELPD
jgi:hypothetical protein